MILSSRLEVHNALYPTGGAKRNLPPPPVTPLLVNVPLKVSSCPKLNVVVEFEEYNPR